MDSLSPPQTSSEQNVKTLPTCPLFVTDAYVLILVNFLQSEYSCWRSSRDLENCLSGFWGCAGLPSIITSYSLHHLIWYWCFVTFPPHLIHVSKWPFGIRPRKIQFHLDQSEHGPIHWKATRFSDPKTESRLDLFAKLLLANKIMPRETKEKA